MKNLQHHYSDLIRFGYSCFDRMILSGSIVQFIHTKRARTIAWFLRNQRQAQQLNRAYFAKISATYQKWVDEFARKTGVEVLEVEKDIRRKDWVEPFYRQLGTRSGVAVILKAREGERIAWHCAKTNSIAVTCFASLAGHGCFRTKDLLADVQKALNNPSYTLGQLRYDLSKLRAKGLLVRLPGRQSYQLTDEGYRIAILYLKLYQRLYAPLTAGIRDPVPGDNKVLEAPQFEEPALVNHILGKVF